MLKKNRYSNFIIVVVVVIVIVLTMFIMPCNYFRRPLRGRALSCINSLQCLTQVFTSRYHFLYRRHHLLYNAPGLIEGIVHG